MTEKPLGMPNKEVPKTNELLSFMETGRRIPLHAVAAELHLMKGKLKKPMTAKVATRVCKKSGTHLLKMVSPRVDTEHACLCFVQPYANERPKILPAVNAADIPFCKVLYRPLEIIGQPSRSVIDHILNPDDASDDVLAAFAEIFGKEVLEAASAALLQKRDSVTKLAAGEFPVIFVPRANGSDLQITPVSLAEAYMGVKSVINDLYTRKKEDGVGMSSSAFENQAISSKPQNISGAIGGPRRRVMARMPRVMEQTEAGIYRFAHGGSFPRWRDKAVALGVLRYADMIEADKSYNDRNTRKALDGMADRLIGDAQNFIDEIIEEVEFVAEDFGLKPADIPKPPGPANVLIRLRWRTDDRNKARKALASRHFMRRMKHFISIGKKATE